MGWWMRGWCMRRRCGIDLPAPPPSYPAKRGRGTSLWLVEGAAAIAGAGLPRERMAPCHLTPLVPAKILSPPPPPPPYSSRPFAKRSSDEELASGVGMGGVFGLKHRLSTPRLVGSGADGVVRRPA